MPLYNPIKTLIVGIVFTISHLAVGQFQINQLNSYRLNDWNDSIPSSIISSNFIFSNASNFLSNQMYNEVFEGTVSDQTRSDVTTDLEEDNIQVQLIDFDINFKTLLSGSLYLTVIGRSYNFRHTNFSEDFTKLLLNGNAPYEGTPLNLLGTEYLSYRYQSLGAGLEKKWKNTILGGTISLIKASYLSQTTLERGSLYTHQYGTQIDIDLNYNAHKSVYVESNDFLNIAGWGASANLYIAQKTKFGVFGFEIDNLGAISYNNQEESTTDTTLNYRGVDLINGGGTDFELSTEVEEVFDVTITENQKTTYTLPTSFHITYENTFANNRISLYSGLRYYTKLENIPQVYTNWAYNIKNTKFSISPSVLLAYGGFGEFDWGIGLSAKFNDRMYFNAQTISLQQVLTPQSSSSFGFNFSTAIRL